MNHPHWRGGGVNPNSIAVVMVAVAVVEIPVLGMGSVAADVMCWLCMLGRCCFDCNVAVIMTVVPIVTTSVAVLTVAVLGSCCCDCNVAVIMTVVPVSIAKVAIAQF
jgi:hypothetical protein